KTVVFALELVHVCHSRHLQRTPSQRSIAASDLKQSEASPCQSQASRWSDLDDNLVLALDEAAGVLPCSDVPENDVAPYRAKERNPGTDEHRNASDNEALNEPGLKKPLNGDPAIHVNVPDAASSKLRRDFNRIPRHTLHYGPDRGGG